MAGTFCGGKVQGTWADKQGGCLTCNFYKTIKNQKEVTSKQGSFMDW
ncbi:MAG: hypothetical protein ACYSWP_15330 [Planctomycetota bacterium]